MLCVSKPPSDRKQASQKIDKELRDEEKRLAGVQQLLLLGTGESGKTTIIKQMKILHINGFSEQEKREKITNIKQNIHESIYSLVSAMSKITPPVELQHDNSKTSAEYILTLGSSEPNEYSDDYYDHVKTLWTDLGVKETFKRSNEFQLIDSASQHNSFLDRIDDIRKPDYMPTVQDMLFCRIMTIAISKIEFKIQYKGQKIEFWMYDVGGQRGERKKWISVQVFEGIHAILFLIAASDFDQTLREDEKTNRLKEGFKVFGDIFWSRFVRQAGKIVFLNKQDLLKWKIENGHQMQNYFPEFTDYKAPDKDALSEYDKAKFFMRDRIFHIAKNRPKSETADVIPVLNVKLDMAVQSVYVHFTIATDTNNIKLVFDSVKDKIITDNLQKAGLI